MTTNPKVSPNSTPNFGSVSFCGKMAEMENEVAALRAKVAELETQLAARDAKKATLEAEVQTLIGICGGNLFTL